MESGLDSRSGWTCSYRPAFAAMLFFVTTPQPLAQEEASALGRGAGGGTSGPRRIFIAGWRDLNGRKLQVLLGARSLKLILLQLFLLAHDILHTSHFKTLAPQRRAARAGQCRIHLQPIAISISRTVDLQRRQLQGLRHGSASAQSRMSPEPKRGTDQRQQGA